MRYKDNKKKYMKVYRRTIVGFFSQCYSHQKCHSESRNHPMPDYSKQDLINKYMNTKLFKELFKNWEKSGYHTNLRPSFDRPDSSRPYTLDNLQLMTWRENEKKGHKEGPKKPILQYSLGGIFIKEFESGMAASREFNCSSDTIIKCCRGESKTSRGFKWKFKN